VRAVYLNCTEANDDVCYKIGCAVELLTKILNLVFILLWADESDFLFVPDFFPYIYTRKT
jgi:hypothetical protein